jgi:hypothetical protein
LLLQSRLFWRLISAFDLVGGLRHETHHKARAGVAAGFDHAAGRGAALSQRAFKAGSPQLLQELKILKSATPFQTNNGQLPPPEVYKGPLFALNHTWPAQPLPPLHDTPWQQAIGGGQITPANAHLYADKLKDAVADQARGLLFNYDSWDAAKAGWYNEPWMGAKREAIHGTYFAGEFGPSIFPNTGLRATFNTHVLTYYDARAAGTLRAIWGDSGMAPTVAPSSTQFTEGSIIIKAAVFVSEDAAKPSDWWDAMQGAQVWPVYTPLKRGGPDPKVRPGYVAQFDIIVKDSQSAPKTGWVFMTLVYDSSVKGDAWAKLVPLGAQWGNDPQANKAGMPLAENWVNPKAPPYSKMTLGFGGRLSGPNDGATNDIAVNGKVIRNAPDSSCMSCHSTSQWNVAQKAFGSMLIPSAPASGEVNCDANGKPLPPGVEGPNVCSPPPGSPDWMRWFQNRPGNVPMDTGLTATDFDLVSSFQSLRAWAQATSPSKANSLQLQRLLPHQRVFNDYNGAPLKTR